MLPLFRLDNHIRTWLYGPLSDQIRGFHAEHPLGQLREQLHSPLSDRLDFSLNNRIRVQVSTHRPTEYPHV